MYYSIEYSSYLSIYHILFLIYPSIPTNIYILFMSSGQRHSSNLPSVLALFLLFPHRRCLHIVAHVTTEMAATVAMVAYLDKGEPHWGLDSPLGSSLPIEASIVLSRRPFKNCIKPFGGKREKKNSKTRRGPFQKCTLAFKRMCALDEV